MIVDAYKLGEDRPLILAGGAKAIYEPWDFFGLGPDGGSTRRRGRHRRGVRRRWSCSTASWSTAAAASIRARRSTACAAPACSTTSPAWCSAKGDEKEPLGRLINTGIQRLVQDLDELPHPIDGLGLLEPPHRRRTPVERGRCRSTRLHRYAGMISRGDDARLQVPLPVLPDPRVQPVHLPLEEPRAARATRCSRWPSGPASTPSSAPTTTSSTTARRSRRSSRRWPRARFDGKPFRDIDLLRHRGDRVRRLQEPGPPAAVPRGRPAGHLVRHRGHDRRAGQEGPEPGEDDGRCSSSSTGSASARCR